MRTPHRTLPSFFLEEIISKWLNWSMWVILHNNNVLLILLYVLFPICKTLRLTNFLPSHCFLHIYIVKVIQLTHKNCTNLDSISIFCHSVYSYTLFCRWMPCFASGLGNMTIKSESRSDCCSFFMILWKWRILREYFSISWVISIQSMPIEYNLFSHFKYNQDQFRAQTCFPLF